MQQLASAAEEFEALLAPILDSAFGTALHLARHHQEAENIVQEAALRAFRSFHTFHRGTNFRAWFLRIVTNLFWEQCRQRKRRPQTVSVDEAPDLYMFIESGRAGLTQDVVLDRLSQEQVEKALGELPDEFRVVATLYFLQDLSYPEIAEILDLPPGTVRSRLHRARKLLQKRLWHLAQAEGLSGHAAPPSKTSERAPHDDLPHPPPAHGPPVASVRPGKEE